METEIEKKKLKNWNRKREEKQNSVTDRRLMYYKGAESPD